LHDITTGIDPSLLDEQKINDAILTLLCKPFEGMILHTVCFPEVGWSKLLIDIFHLVSGASVCTNSSNSTIATTMLFLALLNHFCCCQSSSLDSHTHTGKEYMTMLTAASLEPPPLPETAAPSFPFVDSGGTRREHN
jgi:hypothetical protein